VSLGLAIGDLAPDKLRETGAKRLAGYARSVSFVLLGIAILLGVWWVGGWIVASNPATANFAGFAPAKTFERLWRMLITGEAVRMALPSLGRIGGGLGRSPSACRSAS